MANSRRRERELARRRYERRRLREQQERARRRRRATVIGAGVGTAAVLAGIIVLAVSLVGGSSSKPTASISPAASSTPTPTSPPPAPARCAQINPNPPAKGQPRVPDVLGKAPTHLVVKDVKKGSGRAAKAGDSLSVTYIGIACSDGQVFDATYKDGGKPFTVAPLGKAGVIAGWNQGLIGVRAGGVRELVIPASLGYGSTGAGSAIKPNETLIFLVTVKSVKK